MPIKDPIKRKEYQRELMRKRRQGLTEPNVSPVLDPNNLVSPVRPENKMLDQGLTVSPQLLDPEIVSSNLKELDLVRPCPNCLQLKEQLDQVATLPQAYIDKLLSEKEQQQQKELKLKEIQLETLRQQLAEKNSNPKLTNIPLNANFASLFYSKDYRKFITHACFASCWTGKYCNNCQAFGK